MISLDYEKRKNTEFFNSLQTFSDCVMNQIQNYVPIYNRFFKLNKTNYNSVNLNHRVHVVKIQDHEVDSPIYNMVLKDGLTDETIHQPVFIKYAPLVDPYKYLIGKAPSIHNKLPQIQSTEADCPAKLLRENNSAYIDGFFGFLTSRLLYSHRFLHGVDFYGMFNAIKKDFKVNIADDLTYLCKNDYFNKQKNVAFQVEDYSAYIDAPDATLEEGATATPRLKKLEFKTRQTRHSQLSSWSIESFPEEELGEVFMDTKGQHADTEEEDVGCTLTLDPHIEITDPIVTSLKSSSTCSSRTSLTSVPEKEQAYEDEDEGKNKDKNKDKNKNKKSISNMDHEEEEEDEDEEEEEESVWDTEEDDDDDDEDDDSSLMSDDTVIEATIPNYPVAVICMEHCECTMDKWIHDNETIPDEEWFAALFQIVMILLTYQKAFSFTHNDLHSNNIMFNTTSHKYLYYMYHKKIYKVPTFGKLFKIIDFGRAIFKFNGQLFCSDAFEQGADASAQYNFEPYFNEKKSRLDPNPSFDLCRLACSLFDYLVEDMDDIADIQRCSPLVRLMVEWCTDDNGINVLYKRDGTERYPDFKLYKMIAKCVHAHTPQAQLDRPMFAAYAIPKKTFEKDEKKGVMMMNIDSIPSFVSSSTDS